MYPDERLWSVRKRASGKIGHVETGNTHQSDNCYSWLEIFIDFWQRPDMNKFSHYLQLSRRWIYMHGENFFKKIQVNSKLLTLSAGILAIIITLVISLFLQMRPSIRESQVNQLIYSNLSSRNVKGLDSQDERAFIQSKSAVSIMFAKPNQKNYLEAFKLLEEKEEEMNRPIYFYPLVYQAKKKAKQYQFDENEITFLFFEKGKEKNRVTFEQLKNPKETLIPELNRLPMSDIYTK